MNLLGQRNPWESSLIPELIEQYLEDCRARRLSKRTLEIYGFYLNRLAHWCSEIGVSDVNDLNPELMRQHIIWHQQPGPRGKRSSSYVHGAFRVLRSFFKFLETSEIIATNPVNALKAPRLPKKILEPLTADQIQRVIQSLSGWEKTPRSQRTGLQLFEMRNLALFYFLLDTGMRAAEASSCRIGDLDLRTGRVFVRCGKGEKDRIVFLSSISLRYVQQYVRLRPDLGESQLWIGQFGPLGTAGIQMIFKALGRELGFSVSPHKIRRTFAILMLRNGSDLYRLRDLMGHADIRTLERYLKIDENDLRVAHERWSPVSQLGSSQR